jgi:hypothetical protein
MEPNADEEQSKRLLVTKTHPLAFESDAYFLAMLTHPQRAPARNTCCWRADHVFGAP